MRFAAIDVGTNSIHLIVVELDPYVGSTRTLLKAREMVRLGAGDAMVRERLGRKAIMRGVDAIGRFVEDARRANAVEIRIAATSAVRDARNRDEFTDAVLARTGITVDVLSGREEARLIHLGVSRGTPLDETLSCIIDIGGGSTEFIVADQHRTYFLKSLPIGSLRLYERFRAGDTLAIDALRAHLREMLGPLCELLNSGEALPGAAKIAHAIGTSGTWIGLAALDAADRGVPFVRSQGAELRLDRLHLLQSRMLGLSVEERRALPGMSPRRSDIIVAGNEIAIAALEGLGLADVTVCDRALREGIVADFLQRNHDKVKAVGDLRLRRLDSARDLAARFGAHTMHEAHVADYALALFDSLADPELSDPIDRDLLTAAAVTHDVGHSINKSSHHKHSAYIVRHAHLVGWRPKEREILAQIVRYHRKSLPKPTHHELMALDPATRRKIERLAAILRIADGLDSRHLGRVQDVRFLQASAPYRVEVRAEGDITAELSAAAAKGDLFARVYGQPLEFIIAPANEELAQRESLGAAS